MKLKKKFSQSFVGVLLAVLAFAFGFSSCDDETTTDHTSFAMYYSSLTDISPSMNGTIAHPTYKGAVPSNFAISGISFGEANEAYTGECFVINPETGAIDIVNSESLSVGLYKISVSCTANGTVYRFDDAVTVNFMKPVPAGITIEPSQIQVGYDLVMSDSKLVELPTAQVTTDGDHISISGYEISSIKKGEEIISNFPEPLFNISEDGVISIVQGSKRIGIGSYVLSLKLNTAVAGSDSELGLFADAMTINITSKPVSLTYEPNSDLLEEETEGVNTEYTSKTPTLEGSVEGLNFSIASVEPASGFEKFSIDPTSGAIKVASGHGFKQGESYVVSVLVKNQFCEEGVTFNDVFKLDVVEFIAPIENFNYAETTVKQALAINVNKNPEFKGGGNLKFEFAPEDKAKYDGILTLDEKTGQITAEKYNKLAVGQYDVNIVASNNKGTVTTTLKLNIVDNENYFTYISYGNNISDNKNPMSIYDNQYRYHKDSEMSGVTLTAQTDIKDPSGMTWEVDIKNQMKGTSIDKETGALTLSEEGWKTHQLGYVFVTATKGEGDEAISRTFPVFFHFSGKVSDITVEYTPFVLHVNPKVGGRSVVPAISNKEGFLMDYRRSFNYQNMNGKRNNGTELESGEIKNNQFLKNLWNNVAKESNYGKKLPMSYYDGTGKKRKTDDVLNNETISYVDNDANQNQYSVVVNPNVWYDDGWADGVFTGQMTFVTNNEPGGLGGSKNQIFPIAIWLDKDFE